MIQILINYHFSHFYWKRNDGQCHNRGGSYQILINMWLSQGHSLDMEEDPQCSFSCLVFREKLHLDCLFLLLQCFLTASVFTALLQQNLTTLWSHSYEVPVVFSKIAPWAFCWRCKHFSLCLAAVCCSLSMHIATAWVVWQAVDQIQNVRRGSWGPCGGAVSNEVELDAWLFLTVRCRRSGVRCEVE